MVCQSCGLCCDGTLFDFVPLIEREQVPSPLVVLRDEAGARIFRQCCTALSGTSCSVYTSRPSACRVFECLLIESVKDGEIDLDSALEVVARAKSLIEAVDRTLPLGVDAPLGVMRRARRSALETVATDEHKSAEAWFEVHFLGRRHPSAPEE